MDQNYQGDLSPNPHNVKNTNSFIYLHGFASGPQSAKANYLVDKFADLQIKLETPDLNQNDFSHLTLTRQIQQVVALFPPHPTPVTLIGSSFGGLTTAWLGCQNSHLISVTPQINKIVLLAPAFQFLDHWLTKLGDAGLNQWEKQGYLSVYHYQKQDYTPINYQFFRDLKSYDETLLNNPVPTLIFHGRNDDVIPIQSSRNFAINRPWVKLIELDSDHSLLNVMAQIWEEIYNFCEL